MEKFKHIGELVKSFKNGKIDFQDSKTGDFSIVAKEDGKKFYQSYIKVVESSENSIQIGPTFFEVSEKVFF